MANVYVLYEGDDCVGVFGSYGEIARKLGVKQECAYLYATDEMKRMVRQHKRGWKKLRTVWREEVA